MSKVSGLDLKRDEFSIPANRMTGQDGTVHIPRQIIINEKTSVAVIREIQAGSESFMRKMDKINNLISSLEVDPDTDTIMMDKQFITKLTKLISQAQNDFNRMISAATE